MSGEKLYDYSLEFLIQGEPGSGKTEKQIENDPEIERTEILHESEAYTSGLNIFPFLEFLNPGRGIIETKSSPHARTLRTDFKGKLRDAFFVFFGVRKDLFSLLSGSVKSGIHPQHTGVLDVATLFIPAMLDRLTMVAMENENWFLFGFLLVFDVPLVLARMLIAAVLAFNPLSLLVIAIVNGISQYGEDGEEMKDTLLKLSNESETQEIAQASFNTGMSARSSSIFIRSSTKQVLSELQEKGIPVGIENLNTIVGKTKGGDHTVEFYVHNDPDDFSKEKRDNDTMIGSFVVDENNSHIRKAMEAAIKLNWGGLTSKLEASNEQSDQELLRKFTV